jgi:3-hydroxyisobutyrate dehydrogenase-like beta-hydroxyacid dehydrogenase
MLMSSRVGFAGLGIMGRAMAENVLRAGYEVTVYNRSKEKCSGLREKGAKVADSPLQLVQECEVIILMLTGPEAIDALLWSGDKAAAQALNVQKTLINMSSVSPAYTDELYSRLEPTGCSFLDAPVSGSKKPAEEATLVILAGGEEQAVKAQTPLLQCMGKKVVHCGSVGQGSMMKMAINLLLGVMMQGLTEMVNFGRQGGLSLDSMLEVVQSGPLNCGLYNLKEPMLRDNEYPTQFPLKHMTKDLKFVADTAYAQGANVPAAQAALQLYRTAWGQNHGDLDFAAVIKALELSNDKK